MLGYALNPGGGAPFVSMIAIKDVDPAFVQAENQWLFCLDPIDAAFPGRCCDRQHSLF